VSEALRAAAMARPGTANFWKSNHCMSHGKPEVTRRMTTSALEALSSSSNTMEIFNGFSVGCLLELRATAGAAFILESKFFIRALLSHE
jgi:hypothetical protein